MGKTDSIQVPIFTGDPQDYETDFHAWSMEQSSRLRLMRIPGLDTETMAEEIESLGRSDKRELGSRAELLLVHLLKWTYQPPYGAIAGTIQSISSGKQSRGC